MKIGLTLIALPFAFALTGAQAADRTPEARLEKALKGYEPGQPVKCIMLRNIRSSQIFDRIGILYDMGGGLKYLNRPASGAESLRSGTTMVTDTRSSELCNIDIVRLYDASSRMSAGFVGLGDFVPYKKPSAKSR
ncbi:MAG: hypothetical protein AB7E05_06825 [Sphingobium sp.]